MDVMRWTAVVLAGGLGTRLRMACPDTPKPLVPVLGRPFLDWVLLYLHACGLRRVVISTGDRADHFRSYNGRKRVSGLELRTVAETEALGTAGGFCRAAATAGPSTNWIALNGDSLLLTPLRPILEGFDRDSFEAAIVAVRVEDATRYGTLDIEAGGWLRGFCEKKPGSGMVNAGIYLLRSQLLARFPKQRPLSFENDVFPRFIASGHALRAYPCVAPFLDIGIPEALAQAPAFLRSHFPAFLRQAES